MKLRARDGIGQFQSFRARADPLAGTDFCCRVVIILRKVFLEVTFGIGQSLVRNGSKHTVRAYPVSERPKRASHTISALATAGDSKGTWPAIVRPLGTIFRRKHNDFAETGR